MLESLHIQRSNREVYRLANIPTNDDFDEQLELDLQSRNELEELLAETSNRISLHELINGPFSKRTLRKTRFSDGSFPVFYSSLEPETAEEEVKYWYYQNFVLTDEAHPVYYHKFSCIFDGNEVDLREKIREWPSLIDDRDYEFCNKIGATAKEMSLDGLVTFSARKKDGVNQPIFSRQAISKPQIWSMVVLGYDSFSGMVTLREIDGES